MTSEPPILDLTANPWRRQLWTIEITELEEGARG